MVVCNNVFIIFKLNILIGYGYIVVVLKGQDFLLNPNDIGGGGGGGANLAMWRKNLGKGSGSLP